MTTFKDTKEAIQFANEHLISGGYFNNLTLTASPIGIGSHSFVADSIKAVDIINHLYHWSLASIKREPTRIFYLFGDFGSGKSGVCKELVSQLYQQYEESRYGDTTAKPTLPLYLNLRLLTGIYGDFEFANKSLSELIEVMFCVTGIPTVTGDNIIKLIRQYPCVVVFDGFDEAVQKLNKNQQNGFLNKLLSLLPNVQYTKDLMRISGQPVEESTIPDSPSRIVISCRTQLFESAQEQNAFIEAFYTTGLSINGIHNYQAYQIDNLPISTVKKALKNYIIKSNKTLLSHQQLAVTNTIVQEFLKYLADLSINPLLLSLSKSLLPSVQASINKTGTINSAEMFTNLITKLMQRDSSKSIINIQEKQKVLGAIALQIWQDRTGFISLEKLRQFFYNHYSDYRQIQLGINTGRIEIETALQDLHSSMLVRDELDRYRFYHPLIFDYFLAVGIFEAVMSAKTIESLTVITDFITHDSSQDNVLNEDTLIFVSQMVFSLMVRGDMNSYDHFYRHWLGLCQKIEEQVAKTHHNHSQAQNIAIKMWEMIIDEEWKMAKQ